MLKKKFFFVALCTLLLTLLLGLCGTCYASIDEVDLKNFCYNFMTKKDGFTESQASNWIDNSQSFASLSSSCSAYFNNDNYKILLIGLQGNIYFLVKSNFDYKLVIRDTTNINITANGYSGYQVHTADSNWISSYSSAYMNNLKNGYFYTDDNMYYNNNIYYSAPKYYPDSHIFDEYYSRYKFEFSPLGELVRIYGHTQNYFYLRTAGYDIDYGSFVDCNNISKIQYRFATYNTNLQRYNSFSDSSWYTLYDYNRDGLFMHKFPNATNNNGVVTSSIHIDTHNHAYDLMQIKFTPDTTQVDYILVNYILERC